MPLEDMDDHQPTGGLVACVECGGAHHADHVANGDDMTCPRCGNDSFTDLLDPSTL